MYNLWFLDNNYTLDIIALLTESQFMFPIVYQYIPFILIFNLFTIKYIHHIISLQRLNFIKYINNKLLIKAIDWIFNQCFNLKHIHFYTYVNVLEINSHYRGNCDKTIFLMNFIFY